MRTYYFVAEMNGAWEICLREPQPWISPIQYGTRPEAVAGAIRLAHAEWTATRAPTGVRVRQAYGDWVDEALFGDEPPAIFTPIV
jgi:hypothetical protein